MNVHHKLNEFGKEPEVIIHTLRVVLVRGMYCEGDWMADIELPSSSTLEELHLATRTAVGFDDDHCYCFFVARTDRSRDRVYFDDEDGLIFTKTLEDLFPLQPKKSLFYLFDFGDNWIFKISKSRKAPHDPVDGVTYPNVVNETGTKPTQYPTFDEDDE
ncbi:Plasmid pRiA4b ORF-3-like protein [Planctomycetes bacterium CA13]|uniref:Plasmid pRiA4b ORF-3-like protein n=1 Tax=Novipirellula herctigrandis TaxID=2527986 RepID=A0A5C5ZB44_9BACT|nr:Plasmid pRiA4b ORF-3-like protein [Planctomycetes bacterium CA13]